MKKKIIATMLAVCLSLSAVITAPATGLISHAYSSDTQIESVIEESEEMEIILDMLVKNKGYADTIFKDTGTQMENTGRFGNGGGQKMRTTNNYALLYAFLYKELPDSEYPVSGEFKQDLLEKAIKAIRFGVFTHNSVKKMTAPSSMATDSGKYWGPNNWQSSMYANGLLFAAALLWDELGEIDPDFHEDVEKVASAEGDRAVRTAPRSYTTGNTGAEENAWDTNGPALAANMFPDHENASDWNDAAIKFAMNTFSQKSDADNTEMVDGKPVNEWVNTWNIFEDYALENHNILHPVYQMSPILSFADSAIYYAYFDHELPEAFTYKLQEVFDSVCKKMVAPTGEWIYPNGCDWTMILPGNIEPIAYVAVMCQDPEAKLLETRLLQMARLRQEVSGDGRLVHESDIGSERESVEMKRLMYTYLIHKYLGDWPKENVTWDEFVSNNAQASSFLDGNVVTEQNKERFASISWKNKYMGLVIPNSDAYLTDGYVNHPNLPNIFGSTTVSGKGNANSGGTHVDDLNGEAFRSIGYISANSGALNRYVAMTALPGNAVVVMENTKANEDLEVTGGYSLPLSFQTDVISGNNKVIDTAEGSDSFTVDQTDVKKTYKSDWVNVDGHTAVLLDTERTVRFGGYQKSAQIGGSTLSFDQKTGAFKEGDTIDGMTGVILSNLSSEEVKELQDKNTYFTMPKGWQGALVQDTDGTAYAVVNNFYGEDGTFQITGEESVPVILGESSLKSADGVLEAEVTLENKGMSSTYETVTKYAKVESGESLDIINSKAEDTYFVKNEGEKAANLTASFVTDKGMVSGKQVVKPGEIYQVSVKGETVHFSQKDKIQLKPEAVKDAAASVKDGEVTITWNTDAEEISGTKILRKDYTGKQTEVATVEKGTNQYVDRVSDSGMYTYQLVNMDKSGFYGSDEVTTNAVVASERTESNDRINVAYKRFAGVSGGTQASYPGSNMVNGNLSDFMVSNEKPSAETPVELEIDLGGSYPIDSIEINPRTENKGYGPKEVQVAYEDESGAWQTLPQSYTLEAKAAKTISFDKITASKVKIIVKASYSATNTQVCELKVWKADESPDMAAPEDLQAAVKSFNAVELTWKDCSDNETEFLVQRKTEGGSYEQIATAPANAQEYTDTTATGETSYTYKITATNGKKSADSNEVTVTTDKGSVLSSNVALGKKVTAKKNQSETANTVSNLVDGNKNMDSNFFVGEPVNGGDLSKDNPVEILVDLGEAYSIDKVSMLPRKQGTRFWVPKEGEILVSDTEDGEYLPVCSFTPDDIPYDAAEKVLTFDPVTARYMKLVVTDSWNSLASGAITATTPNTQMCELEVYTAVAPWLKEVKAELSNSILEPEETAQLEVTPVMSDGSKVELDAITYGGYDKNMVSVDADGKVKAIAEGTTSIQVTGAYNGVYASASVQAAVRTKTPVEAVTLDKSQMEMFEGEKVNLTVSLLPENATDRSVIWSIASDNGASLKLTTADGEKEVLTDQETGVTSVQVEGVLRGSAVIKVTSANHPELKAECTVKVKGSEEVAPSKPANLTGKALDNGNVKLSWTNTADPDSVTGLIVERKLRGEEWQPISQALLADAEEFTDDTDKQGGAEYFYRIGAVNDYGTSYSATRIIKTFVGPEEMSITSEEMTLKKGFEESLEVSFQPAETSNQQVVWSVSNGKVQLYGEDGQQIPMGKATNTKRVKVKGYRMGDAAISVVSVANPGLNAECRVHVTKGMSDAPAAAEANPLAASTVALTWEHSGEGVQAYVIERLDENGNFVKLAEVANDVFRYYDVEAMPEAENTYRIGSKSADGTNYSESITVITPEEKKNLAEGLGTESLEISHPSLENGTYSAAHLVDGDRNTPWVQDGVPYVTDENPAVITLDLGEVKTIDQVNLVSHQVDNVRVFGPKTGQISVSVDGSKFIPVYNFKDLDDSNLVKELNFDAVEARYIKISVTAAHDKGPDGSVNDPARNLHLCEIEVYEHVNAVEDIQVEIGSDVLNWDETTQIGNVTAYGADGQELPIKEIQYTSNDQNVAYVDAQGKVTARNAGSAVIAVTAMIDGKSNKCEIPVSVEASIPEDPEISAMDGTSVFLEPRDHYEYAIATEEQQLTFTENPKFTGLSLGQTYTFYQRIKANENHGASVMSKGVEITLEKGYLEGKISLRGIAKVGETLTVDVSQITTQYTGKLTYIWKRQNEVMDQVIGNTYTLTAADQGAVIVAMVAAENCKGALSAVSGPVEGLEVSETGISLDKTTLVLEKGKSGKLTATILPADVKDKTIRWMSSNPLIASVDGDGQVTAQKAGTAVITARMAGGQTASCKVTVTQQPEGVKLNITKKTLGVREKVSLTAKLLPADALNGKLTWKSSNKKVAAVSSTGKVTAKKKGTAVITVITENGKQARCKITVKNAPKTVKVSAKTKTLKVRKSYQIKAKLSSGSAGAITYSSSNKKVATVTSKGKVKALKKGRATITVKTYNGKKAKVRIIVK